MEVKIVLYLDPVTAEETLSVGYIVERDDHILLLNDIIGEDGEAQTRLVIPRSHVMLVESPRTISLVVHDGGKKNTPGGPVSLTVVKKAPNGKGKPTG